MHGQAYWTAIDALSRPGTIGTVHAQIIGANRLRLATDNLTGVAVLPDPALVDLERPLALEIEGQAIFEGIVAADQELRLTKRRAGRWRVAEAPRRRWSLTAYRTNPVAEAPAALTMKGIEAPLANWITDAMRLATGADLALYNRRSYRGLPLPAGTVDEVDLIQCSRPFEQYLVVAELRGSDILNVLEANVRDPGEGLEFVVQLSGASYTFDWGRPVGCCGSWSIRLIRSASIAWRWRGMCRSEGRAARCTCPASARRCPTGLRTCPSGPRSMPTPCDVGGSRRWSRGACRRSEDGGAGLTSRLTSERYFSHREHRVGAQHAVAPPCGAGWP